MTIYVNQLVCPAPVKLPWRFLRWIPLPFICAEVCDHAPDDMIVCPKCGLCRPFVMGKKTGVA